jgi:hypothetical protein
MKHFLFIDMGSPDRELFIDDKYIDWSLENLETTILAYEPSAIRDPDEVGGFKFALSEEYMPQIRSLLNQYYDSNTGLNGIILDDYLEMPNLDHFLSNKERKIINFPIIDCYTFISEMIRNHRGNSPFGNYFSQTSVLFCSNESKNEIISRSNLDTEPLSLLFQEGMVDISNKNFQVALNSYLTSKISDRKIQDYTSKWIESIRNY